MSASLHLASPDDLDRLLPLMAAYHEQAGIEMDEAARRAAVKALLEGLPHGVAYLCGPRRSPVGYIVISFGYSIRQGGIVGFIDEIYIRSAVRGRGMGQEVLAKLMGALSDNGVRALHLERPRANERVQNLFKRLGFLPRDDAELMTRGL